MANHFPLSVEQKMKPDWDKLMDAFADSTTALVADVDCTADGKPLCDANGVRGYPTIKWVSSFFFPRENYPR